MKKIYCRNCQERLRMRDGMYERVTPYEHTDPTECQANGEEHVPR